MTVNRMNQALAVASFVALSLILSSCTKPGKEELRPSVGIGDTVTIGAGPLEIGMAGTSLDGLRELMGAIAANDKEGIFELLVKGRMVFVDTGRVARVLETPEGNDVYVLRVLSGPKYGTKIWITAGQIRELSAFPSE